VRTHHHLRIIARDLADRQEALFETAPPVGLQRRIGLTRAGRLDTTRRALVVAAVCWLPIVVLMALLPGSGQVPRSGMHIRYLVVAPLLVLAESTCGTRLTALTRQFLIGNLVLERDRERFDRIVGSTMELLASPAVELLAWLAAYAITTTVLAGTAWREWSVAMWWNALVSLPLLLVLILGWLWRIALWARLLLLVSRLDLRLVASHPDRAGGLGFVSQSLRAFAIVAFAIGLILAGESARLVATTRAIPVSQVQLDVAVVAIVVTLMIMPLATLTPRLARTYRRGVVEYGDLASDVGRALEARWLASRAAKVRESGLHEPDFSATIDLYSIVSNVHAMRLVPVAFKDVAVLIAFAVLPFVPIVLAIVPVEVLWARAKDLLL
jgi:hypothetical protein